MKRLYDLLPPVVPELSALLPEAIYVSQNMLELAVTACKGHHREEELTHALAELRRGTERSATMAELLQMCATLPARLADKFLLAVAEHMSKELLAEMPSESRICISQRSGSQGWQNAYHVVMRFLLGESLSASGVRKLRYCLTAA